MECKIIQCFIQFLGISKKITNSDRVSSWKSKGLSDKSIKPPVEFSLATLLNYVSAKIRVNFFGSCLKQEKVKFTHKKVVNICIVYEKNLWPFTFAKDFALRNYLFGAVKLTKSDAEFDKYKYSGYGIGFDARGSFPLSNGSGFGKNVIIFVADMSPLMHIEITKKIPL